jgi:hypothetical protein
LTRADLRAINFSKFPTTKRKVVVEDFEKQFPAEGKKIYLKLDKPQTGY